MEDQNNKRTLSEKPVDRKEDMHNELDRIIQRAKDENEALNNVLKNISAQREKEKSQ